MAASERGVRISRLREFHSYVGYGYIDDKRRLIVAEAAKLFADKGVHATSLEEIAKRFGMTRSALYNYFSSKDRILEEILIVAHENACAALAQLAERRVDGANRLRALAIRYVNDTLSDFGRFLTIVEHSTLNTRCRRLMSKSHRVMLNGMISVIEAGIADGTLRPCRPKIAAFSIFGALNRSEEHTSELQSPI